MASENGEVPSVAPHRALHGSACFPETAFRSGTAWTHGELHTRKRLRHVAFAAVGSLLGACADGSRRDKGRGRDYVSFRDVDPSSVEQLVRAYDHCFVGDKSPGKSGEADWRRRRALDTATGQPTVTWVVEDIVRDIPCTADYYDYTPENGHMIGLRVRVSTADLSQFGGAYSFEAKDFS